MPSPRPATSQDDSLPSGGAGMDALAAAFLGAAVLASWVAVDPQSIDAFDAPKIVLAATALAAAAVVALWAKLRRGGFAPPRPTLPAALLAAGLLGAGIAALASTRRGQSLDALRTASLFLLALPAGASAAYARHRGKIVALLAAAASVNGLLVILSAARIYAPFVLSDRSSRSGLGALLGNTGYAGIGLAVAAVTFLPFALAPGKARPYAIAAASLAAAGVLATQSLSGIAVLAAGTVVQGIVAGSRRTRRALGIGVAVVVLAAFAYSPVRGRAAQLLRAARGGEWNAALTARLAPWLAAREMIRAHPILGIGPGNYRSEYIAARVAAENRTRRRLVLWGMPTNSFAQAHNDYLDLFAAVGIPAGACVLAAYAALMIRLVRRARGDPSAAAPVSLLAAGAVAAFTWFPFQIVPTAVWLLLESGHAHRIAGRSE